MTVTGDRSGPSAELALDVRLLGPVRASVGGRPARITGDLGRTVLAVLALDVGASVTVDRLVDALWGDRPPATAREQIHNQVSRLRRALRASGAGDVIVTDPAGYRLDVDPAASDVVRVRENRAAAAALRHDGRIEAAAEQLRRALDTWSGTPLGGVAEPLAAAVRPSLEELRLVVTEEHAAATLAVGDAAALVPELGRLARENPLREPLHRLLIEAHDRAGRRADALTAYRDLAATLRAELGVDPSPELREVHSRLLREHRGEPDPPAAVPAQLPPRLRHYVGRGRERDRLQHFLGGPATPGPPRLAVLTGMAGVGKTALAIQAASDLQTCYPDGQLYADLRGFDERPQSPATVLGYFLRALGVSAAEIAADLDARSAQFRTHTAGRAVLVVLDNVGDETQAEPLLPAASRCATIITSRSVLPGLDSPLRVRVGPLPAPDAAGVLVRAAGPDRLLGHDRAAAEIVRACAGLPLALRIAGARLATSPALAPETLTRQLHDDSLRELTLGAASVPRSLRTSVTALPRQGRRALELLAALATGHAGSWPVAAALRGSVRDADALLAELSRVNLVETVAVGGEEQYGLHDLVRAYVTHTETGRRTATELGAQLAWATVLAETALGVEYPERVPEPDDDRSAVDATLLALVAAEPRGWIRRHWPTLCALVGAAVEAGRITDAARLLQTMTYFGIRLDYLDDLAELADRLHAVSTPSSPAQVIAAVTRAEVGQQHGRYPEVTAQLAALLVRPDELAPVPRLDALLLLGAAHGMCARHTEAVTALGQALDLAVELRDGHAEFRAWFSLAENYRVSGTALERALECSAQALRLADTRDDLKDQAIARFSQVRLLQASGRTADAPQLAAEALERCRRSGDRVGETWCLVLTAETTCAAGDVGAARRAGEQAVALARHLGRPDAEAAAEVALASAALAVGDHARARTAAERADRLTERFDSPVERRKVDDLHALLAAVTAEDGSGGVSGPGWTATDSRASR